MSAAASIPSRQPGRLSFGVIAALVVAGILVVAGLAARAGAPPAPLHLASMVEIGQAMVEAGTVMQAHGQAMVEQGQRAGAQQLVDEGEHWRRDGQALVQGGQWMAMDPTAPASLQTTPRDLAAGGSLGELTRVARAMQHDPTRLQATDLEALRWAGLAMRAEGQAMAEHGVVMAERSGLMRPQHPMSAAEAVAPRAAAQAMGDVGAVLAQNGQAMFDYADSMRRSLGER